MPDQIEPITALTVVEHAAEIGPLADKVAKYIAASKAPATLIAYRSDWKRFSAWCAARSLPALPASPETIALYIADMGGNKAAATITRALSAISKAHQAAGYESPCTMNHAAVKEVWAGIKRTHGTKQHGKAALLTSNIRVLLSAVPDKLLGRRDTAMLLLGYAGAFRRSELVAFTIADLTFIDEGLKLFLPRGKTDQEGEGRYIGVPYGSNPALCPVRSVKRWIEESGLTDGPLFRGITRHGRISDRALTGQVVRNVVKRYCTEDMNDFSAHSLRAGFVTQAKINGATDQAIMNQTGHKSPAMVWRYTRYLTLFQDNAAGRLGL